MISTIELSRYSGRFRSARHTTMILSHVDFYGRFVGKNKYFRDEGITPMKKSIQNALFVNYYFIKKYVYDIFFLILRKN